MPHAPEDPADALWLLPPGELVAARDALARRLRAEGQRSAAEEVARMRRPTWDAHAVNVLARREPATVAALVDVGERLRSALAAADGAALRALSTHRRDAVDAAVRLALQLTPAARSAGDAVRTTLAAAVADPDLAAQVSAGRLERGLCYAGLGLAATVPVPPRPEGSVARQSDPEPEGQGQAAAPRRLRAVRPDADAARAAARAELHLAEEDLTGAQLARAEAQDRADALAAELAAARDELAAAQRDVRAATRERDRARATLERLERPAGG